MLQICILNKNPRKLVNTASILKTRGAIIADKKLSVIFLQKSNKNKAFINKNALFLH